MFLSGTIFTELTMFREEFGATLTCFPGGSVKPNYRVLFDSPPRSWGLHMRFATKKAALLEVAAMSTQYTPLLSLSSTYSILT